MQNAAPPLGAALACEARAKPGGRPGISRASCRYRSETRKTRRPSRRGAFPPSPSASVTGAISATSTGWLASIAEVGLLHPVVITPGNVLIAGERRLAACAFLLWREVPVTVVDIDKVMKGEFAEDSELGDAPPARPRQGAAHARQGRGNRRHRLARGRRQGVPIANRLLNGGQS